MKKQYKDAVLCVECGYKYRFFGEDAEVIFSKKDSCIVLVSYEVYGHFHKEGFGGAWISWIFFNTWWKISVCLNWRLCITHTVITKIAFVIL